MSVLIFCMLYALISCYLELKLQFAIVFHIPTDENIRVLCKKDVTKYVFAKRNRNNGVSN